MTRISITDKICIIGGGPSGLYLAKRLKDLGVNNITIFEKNNEVGGRVYTNERGTDMGAVIFSRTIPKNDIVKLSDSLNLKNIPIYQIFYYSLNSGKKKRLFNVKRILKASLDILKFYRLRRNILYKNTLDVNNKFHCFEPWNVFIEKNNLQNLGFALTASTTGFGYSPEAPAIYNLKYLKPSMAISAFLPFGAWQDGAQSIWKNLAEIYGFKIFLNSKIKQINRNSKIEIITDKETFSFDKLVLACNLKEICSLISDLTNEEEIFKEIITEDYRTYEIEISSFKENDIFMGFFYENLFYGKLNRPFGFFKKNKNNLIFVFYVKASNMSDEDILKAIKTDIEKIGGKFKKVLSFKHWHHFPHVNSEALKSGFFKKLESLQGRNNTFGTGACYTFDTMPDVMNHADTIISRFLN